MADKKLFPTDMSTAELRSLAASFRQQSFFSARNFYEDLLDQMQGDIGSFLNPRQVPRPDRVTPENPEGLTTEGLSQAEFRVRTKAALKRLGYSPEPGEEGSLTDLSSDARINLIAETNEKLAHGYGFKRQGNTSGALAVYPAWELYRQEARKVPRRWQERWEKAGALSGAAIGEGWTMQGGLIALKNHPIWEQLGSSANFDDALDVSYPPFAFNSGMWVRDVDRARCLALGILKEGEQVEPDGGQFHVMEKAA